MKEINWAINTDGVEHRIGLWHRRWSMVEVVIRIDDRIAEAAPLRSGEDWNYSFYLDGHSIEVGMLARLFGYDYYLVCDGQRVKAEGGDEDAEDSYSRVEKVLDEIRYWRDLASQAGLEYVSAPGAKGRERHCLIGHISDFPILIRPMKDKRITIDIPCIWREEKEAFSGRMKLELDEALSGEDRSLFKVRVKAERSFIQISIPDVSKKMSPSELAPRLLKMIDRAAKSIPSFPELVCDGNPEHREGGKARLAIRHGQPMMLCPECVKRVETDSQEFKKNDNRQRSVTRGVVGNRFSWIWMFLCFSLGIGSGILLFAIVSAIAILYLWLSLIIRENRTDLRKKSARTLTILYLPMGPFFIAFSLAFNSASWDFIFRLLSGDFTDLMDSIYQSPLQLTIGILATLGFIYLILQMETHEASSAEQNTIVLEYDSTLTFLQ